MSHLKETLKEKFHLRRRSRDTDSSRDRERSTSIESVGRHQHEPTHDEPLLREGSLHSRDVGGYLTTDGVANPSAVSMLGREQTNLTQVTTGGPVTAETVFQSPNATHPLPLTTAAGGVTGRRGGLPPLDTNIAHTANVTSPNHPIVPIGIVPPTPQVGSEMSADAMFAQHPQPHRPHSVSAPPAVDTHEDGDGGFLSTLVDKAQQALSPILPAVMGGETPEERTPNNNTTETPAATVRDADGDVPTAALPKAATAHEHVPIGQGSLDLGQLNVNVDGHGEGARVNRALSVSSVGSQRSINDPSHPSQHPGGHGFTHASTWSGNTQPGYSLNSYPTIASTASGVPGHKITGFAVASNKRNRDFHALFRSVPAEDYLIDDYGCALQKEILVHGRMYVSEGHICFNSNIFGWVTNLVIGFGEIVAVEKKSTAVVFPNAISITTLHAKHVFASFIARDTTYDLIVNIWRLSHPSVRTEANGIRAIDPNGNNHEGHDGTADDDDAMSVDDDTSVSSVEDVNGAAADGVPVDGASGGGATAEGGPGPATHGPTTCDPSEHYDKQLCDETIPAPLGRVWELLYGDSSTWVKDFLVNTEKVKDVNCGTWEGKTRKSDYIKPLSGPIGPKQTHCHITEEIAEKDFEKYCSIVSTTQTPDVPSGNSFSVKTRTCLMWGENNSTRVIMSFTVEWTGKSWVKGPIEKGSAEGQAAYSKNLIAALKSEFAGGAGRPRKSTASKPVAVAEAEQAGQAAGGPTSVVSPAPATAVDESGGGIADMLGPVGDILRPVLNTTGLLTLLLIIVIWNLRGVQQAVRDVATIEARRGLEVGGDGLSPLLWREQEEGLWQWMEARAGINTANNGAAIPDSGRPKKHGEALWRRLKLENVVQRKKEVMAAKGEDWMTRREIEEAVRITEERLRALKGAVERRHAAFDGDGVGVGEGVGEVKVATVREL
ncbi:hypothetical protein SAICODRAFT_25375 [Saitoella complicata NRRL Y-17804]|nr:uncharacterized protein SAICODRAFT_25375 [Saitoella complicata NRRL Y-17804]ODQ53302.1 hypothetical protein SAICODRAFT_25375 [Saitoella complicata NRRL Y-17804]